ncbi:hypothetical protein PROFUN_00998 [Planoprotostelium fungivorum]|uniref:Uncharacterized protein n=1 Tax=Planoprotostelium fungivorum TaxID=1890364 RepID=A0A2P6N4E6_9EUKA|nr:hypothetical protein PROFUN_00998 [Planoprotostelium fungivorum]
MNPWVFVLQMNCSVPLSIRQQVPLLLTQASKMRRKHSATLGTQPPESERGRKRRLHRLTITH